MYRWIYITLLLLFTLNSLIIVSNGRQANLSQASSLGPRNSSILVDISQTVPPDSLDPSTGFCISDSPLYNAIYQEIVEFNGSNYSDIVPVIAANWTTQNYQNYTFFIRHGVYFSDGVRVNATTVWFSLYRMILMGQSPGIVNYAGLLFNVTEYSDTGYAIPWGVANAIHNVTGLPTNVNTTLAACILSKILSDFNTSNVTIQKIMEYPCQAVVVKGPYEVEINSIVPYKDLLEILAAWATIQDPAFVDLHGGVQPNQPNTYINLHGMPGTGPYVISYIGQGFSTIVLKENPNYWGKYQEVPSIAQPAHIPVIEIEYSVSHVDRIEEFKNNQVQISYVGFSSLSQFPTYDVKQFGAPVGSYYISMNTQEYPTNITALRLAIVHAINYSALLQVFKFGNSTFASEYLGPISPQFAIYDYVINHDHLSLYSYNLSLAISYLNEAGYEGHFYVTLPNGTTVGNVSGTELTPLSIYVLAPVTNYEEEELQIIQKDLEEIGIAISITPVTSSVADGWDTPSTTPDMVYLPWLPDWPDPIFQELIANTYVLDGGFSGNMAWVNESQLNQIYQNLAFLTNQTQQWEEVAYAYKIVYNLAPYIWLPMPYTYFLVQPYVGGFEYNQFVGYFYNTMYYKTNITNATITNTNNSRSAVLTTSSLTSPSTISASNTSQVIGYNDLYYVVVIVLLVGVSYYLYRRRRL
ncbi:peptide ABC transporter permease [Sulfolobales archaeon HS-7]|nr:peptide ABC transporter permease [Sulfolobales archaeon HS-7]